MISEYNLNIINKRLLIILILLLQIAAFAIQYYLRYTNQDLYFSTFEDKTGNVISLIVFFCGLIPVLISLFFVQNLKSSFIAFVLIVSVLSLLLISASGFIYQKETKLILLSIYLALTIFVIAVFTGMLFNGFRRFKFFRSVLISILIFLSGLISVFIFILNYSDDTEFYFENKQKADAGVILGAAVWGGNRPSPVLKERINKGYDVYHKNIVQKLVITGGGSPNELTEGEVSKNLLLKYGVEPENLILENHSGSTVEQIHFVRDSLYQRNKWNKILLVSDLYHLPRALEICKFNNMNAGSIASDREMSDMSTASYCLKESFALIIFWLYGV